MVQVFSWLSNFIFLKSLEEFTLRLLSCVKFSLTTLKNFYSQRIAVIKCSNKWRKLPFSSLILYLCSLPPNQTHSTLIITANGEKSEVAQTSPNHLKNNRFHFFPQISEKTPQLVKQTKPMSLPFPVLFVP